MAPTPTSTARTDYSALKTAIHRRLIQKLDLDRLNQLKREDVRREVGQILESVIAGESTPMNLQERERLSLEVLDEVFGLGPLERLLGDPTISDILVNNYKSVYIERRGLLELTGVEFRDDAHLMSIINRIVTAIGRRIDESSPDGRCASGRWVAGECHYSTLSTGRPMPFDSAFWPYTTSCR